MSFTQITTTQNEFLESYLRGTGKALSSAQAKAIYGIGNLRARMTEMRHAGLRVRAAVNSTGRKSYSISARDVTGSREGRFI